MTTLLNRKFDLLCHSGTCPSYLVDVLSLLVAHANDTELFKSELRTSSNGGSGIDVVPGGNFLPSRATSAIRPDRTSREASERYAADHRTQLMYRQVEDPDTLDDALRASHESVLIAAEQSLKTYAEDLRHMNDIAMATSAKQLRSMRMETQQQMESFRDRVCASVVAQTRDELEVMRSEFAVSIKEDVSGMVQQLHEASVTAQRQVQERTASLEEIISQAQEAMAVVPLQDAHNALTAVEYLQKVKDVEAAAASKVDVESRLRELERVAATLGSAAVPALPSTSAEPTVHPKTDSSDAAAPPLTALPLTATAPGLEASSALANSHSLSNRYNAPAPKPTSRPPPCVQAAAKPASNNAGTKEQPAPSSTFPPAPASAPAPAPSSAPKTCAELIGVAVESADDGVVLTQVVPGSVAASHHLGVGHIISHVGRVAVTSLAAFEDALEASEGQPLKLTTFDPFQGRIRVLTIQPSP